MILKIARDSENKTILTKEQLDEAISKAKDGETIQLGGDIASDINITKLVNIDLNNKTLTGNIEITSDIAGTITIGKGIVTGNLTIDAKNATVNNNATINGVTTIKDVSKNTFNNSGELNEVVIKDANGGSFNNTGVINKNITIDSESDATEALVLKGTIDSKVIVTGSSKAKVNIEGKVKDILLQAENSILTLTEKSTIVNPVVIEKTVTIISTKPVQSKIETGVKVVVKESEKSVGKEITGQGKDKEVEIEVSKSPYDFNTKLDKDAYGANDNIIVSGSLSEGTKVLSDVNITLKVTDANGNLITVEQFVTDINGKFQHSFNVPEDTLAGEYTVTIKANNPVNKTMEEKLNISGK